MGGDTDTCAVIMGAIVVARVDEEGIPDHWRDGICEWPRSVAWMGTLAQRLASQVGRRMRGEALAPSPLAMLLRNIVFLVVVLLHGFRRLAPQY